MTLARQRKDLDKLYIPYEGGGHISLPHYVSSWQPDELDHKEFNTIVIVDGVHYAVASIDLEFKEA